jgi:hypothetical integral membrane protein (TIGR02206 family)
VRAFQPYTWQHLLPVVFFLCACVLACRVGLRTAQRRQTAIGVGLALVVLGVMLGGTGIKIATGVFDVRNDLPLYLCRILALVLPWILWRRNLFWLGICYFWILAGTLQGILTPDLAEGFPSYWYFRYWMLHAGLVVVVLYAIIVFKVRITWKDFWRAILFTQVYLIGVHLVNLILGSNYSYTVEKPPGVSVLDIFGGWPWYLLGAEVLMFLFFGLLMLPWLGPAKKQIS